MAWDLIVTIDSDRTSPLGFGWVAMLESIMIAYCRSDGPKNITPTQNTTRWRSNPPWRRDGRRSAKLHKQALNPNPRCAICNKGHGEHKDMHITSDGKGVKRVCSSGLARGGAIAPMSNWSSSKGYLCPIRPHTCEGWAREASRPPTTTKSLKRLKSPDSGQRIRPQRHRFNPRHLRGARDDAIDLRILQSRAQVFSDPVMAHNSAAWVKYPSVGGAASLSARMVSAATTGLPRQLRAGQQWRAAKRVSRSWGFISRGEDQPTKPPRIHRRLLRAARSPTQDPIRGGWRPCLVGPRCHHVCTPGATVKCAGERTMEWAP
jgi:hypothetical protein